MSKALSVLLIHVKVSIVRELLCVMKLRPFSPVYRATYKMTYKEIKASERGDWGKALLISAVLTGFGVWLSEFLRVKG